MQAAWLSNRILGALTGPSRDRVARTAVPVSLRPETVLFDPCQVIDAVHFPLRGVVALLAPIDDGRTVAVATVGKEGIVGVPLVLGGSLAVRALSAVRGTAVRVEAVAFLEELDQSDSLRDLVQSYTQALFGQISKAVGCNRLHSNEQRLSRWLLAIHDGVGVDEFTTTYRFLGQVLGSDRRAASLSVGSLAAAGLILDRGERLTILDRAGLESRSCECYRVLRNQLAWNT